MGLVGMGEVWNSEIRIGRCVAERYGKQSVGIHRMGGRRKDWHGLILSRTVRKGRYVLRKVGPGVECLGVERQVRSGAGRSRAVGSGRVRLVWQGLDGSVPVRSGRAGEERSGAVCCSAVGSGG